MTAYASRIGRDPEAMYRQIDLAGRTATADAHGLVELMYDELIRALGAVASAVRAGNHAIKSEKIARAVAILFALEAGLDFDRGGDVARTLAGLYRAARKEILDASLGRDPEPFLEVANNLREIAGAWRQLKSA
ncbi:flagellar export chaperone FliS [Sphingomonas sp.]|uniref:flagellar export chaperone FliS n=1 Tax=Sphingomonas sp. TaxID=28214 RepID=UPI001D24E29B|nr:flagellar protein FliS [Sphingomonas sp.]MBX9795343.1 flagellar protein FliS [Sphingomonas sp.]